MDKYYQTISQIWLIISLGSVQMDIGTIFPVSF
jgi:hypothetical protein